MDISVSFAVAGSATAPAQFGTNDWSMADKGTGNIATVTISTLPSNGGSAITALQYQVDGGTWTSLGGTTTGAYDITAANGAHTVAVRAVNAIANGPASATKSVTTTTGASVPAQFGMGDWSVADKGTGNTASITIISLPSNGGSAITALQARVDGGTWTNLRGTSTGAYDITASNGAHTVAVRAVNAVGNGTASATKSVTILSGGGSNLGTYSTTSSILSAAIGASPGDTMTLAKSWISGQSPVMLAALPGNTTVTVVGGTDLVAVSPNMPNDVDFRANSQVNHTTSTGSSIASRSQQVAASSHPIFGGNENLFFGPNFTYTNNAPPFDYKSSSPVGLKLYDTTTVSTKARAWLKNPIRHKGIAHDGHIVWIAELWNGSTTSYHVTEAYTTEGSPCWPGDPNIEANGTHHLRKLVTLRIAPHVEDDDAGIPARWALAPKRFRSSYTPNTTVGSMAALDSAIAGLTNASFAANTSYVIQLSAGVYDASGQTVFTLGGSALNALDALTNGRRVFVIGTPGATIFRSIQGYFPNIDFGWITIRRETEINSAYHYQWNKINAGSSVRFFGCYFDGIDGAPIVGLAPYMSSSIFTQIEVYDCIFTGTKNGIWWGATTDSAPVTRFIGARNFLEVGNDTCRMENGRLRWDRNQIVIGGAWMQANAQYQHPDAIVQSQPSAAGPGEDLRLSVNYNFFDAGPIASAHNDWRLSVIQAMITNRVNGTSQLHFNGNIVQSTPYIGRGLEAGANVYEPSAEFSRNIIFHRPDLVSPGYFTGASMDDTIFGAGTRIMGEVTGFANVLTKSNGSTVTDPFLMPVEWLPDADTGSRASFLQPSEAFDSFPSVSGTYSTGYSLDYSGTTFGGTTRQGYLAAADFGAQPVYQTYAGGGPGLFPAAQMAGRYTDFPANVETHLGWDGAATTLPADLLESYNPAASTISGKHVNPWGSPDEVNTKLLVNFKLGPTIGTGKIAEEVNGTNSWNVEVLANGKVRAQVYQGGSLTYEVTSRAAVQADSHVAVHLNLEYRDWALEFFSFAALEEFYQHRANVASYDRVFVYQVATSQPSKPTPAAGETYIWINAPAEIDQRVERFGLGQNARQRELDAHADDEGNRRSELFAVLRQVVWPDRSDRDVSVLPSRKGVKL